MAEQNPPLIRVGLFVTCLVDLHRPSVAFASIKLLKAAGCTVEVLQAQTCCGQPAMNNGDQQSAQKIAQQVIETFESFDFLVAPSGSCIGTIKTHYVELFEAGSGWHQRAQALASRSFELSDFLVNQLQFNEINAELNARLTYHDSCSGLRELNIQQQPRKLLSQVRGLQLTEIDDTQVCCGFGGTFSIKFPDVSGHMVTQKCAQITQTKAEVVAAGDLGCLINIAGRLKREKSTVKIYHLAEILAGIDCPGIGD